MCQIKVSSPAGRSQAGFDVYYFEIRHRRKQSQGVSVLLFVWVWLCVCVCMRLCIGTKENGYVFNIFIVLCKSAFVCVSFGCYHTSERGLKALTKQVDPLIPPLPPSNCLQPVYQWGGGKYGGWILNGKKQMSQHRHTIRGKSWLCVVFRWATWWPLYPWRG